MCEQGLRGCRDLVSTHSGTGSDDRLSMLNDWMEQFGSDVFNLAYAYVKNYSTAEDISQDVFLRAYMKMDTFRGQSGVKTWLLSITANRCKDHLRSWAVRHELRGELDLDRETANTQTERDVVERLERDELWQVVHRLPVKYREVVILFYQRELTTVEVAEALGISEATVRTRLHRGRTLLRQWMEAGETGI